MDDDDVAASDPMLVAFGLRVRRLREDRSCRRRGSPNSPTCTAPIISSLERGQRNVSLRNIRRIAVALGVSPRVLFDEGG